MSFPTKLREYLGWFRYYLNAYCTNFLHEGGLNKIKGIEFIRPNTKIPKSVSH